MKNSENLIGKNSEKLKKVYKVFKKSFNEAKPNLHFLILLHSLPPAGDIFVSQIKKLKRKQPNKVNNKQIILFRRQGSLSMCPIFPPSPAHYEGHPSFHYKSNYYVPATLFGKGFVCRAHRLCEAEHFCCVYRLK